MKKFLAIILILILVVSLLTACGDSGDSGGGDSGTPSSDKGGGKPTDTDEKEPATAELNQIVVDTEDFKVTLTRYERNDPYGLGVVHTFYFTIENNTDEEIRLGVERASVNGCMLTEMGDTAQKMKTQLGETNDKAYVWIYDSELEKRGITAINDFEFTPRFVGIDSSLLLGGSDYLALEPVTVELPADSGFTQSFDADGVVVLDQEGVKITAVRVDYDFDLAETRDGVWLFIENNTGMDIEVSSDGTVNGEHFDSTSVYLYYQGQVTKGKVSFDYLSFHNPYLREKGIDKIEEVSMTFSVSELTWDLFSSGTTLIDNMTPVTVSFDASGKAH